MMKLSSKYHTGRKWTFLYNPYLQLNCLQLSKWVFDQALVAYTAFAEKLECEKRRCLCVCWDYRGKLDGKRKQKKPGRRQAGLGEFGGEQHRQTEVRRGGEVLSGTWVCWALLPWACGGVRGGWIVSWHPSPGSEQSVPDEVVLGRVLFQLLTGKIRVFPTAEKYQLRKWEHGGKYLNLQ